MHLFAKLSISTALALAALPLPAADTCNEALSKGTTSAVLDEIGASFASPAERLACIRAYREYQRTTAVAPLAGDSREKVIESAAAQRADEELIAAKETETTSQLDFSAWGFGLGLGVSFATGDPILGDAALVDGVVRITDDQSDQTRLLAEAHYFFTPWETRPNIGIGPFVSVNTDVSDGALSSFGIGLMLGLKDSDPTSDNSWNIGLGYLFDANARFLGDGLREDRPLPGNETDVRFTERTAESLYLLVSRGFGVGSGLAE